MLPTDSITGRVVDPCMTERDTSNQSASPRSGLSDKPASPCRRPTCSLAYLVIGEFEAGGSSYMGELEARDDNHEEQEQLASQHRHETKQPVQSLSCLAFSAPLEPGNQER
jgi:hypothetical protein